MTHEVGYMMIFTRADYEKKLLCSSLLRHIYLLRRHIIYYSCKLRRKRCRKQFASEFNEGSLC